MKLLYSSSSIAGGGRGPALLLLLLLLVVAVSTTMANANANANANNPRHLNGDFIKAMNEIHARKEAEERQTALMERLLQDAKPITEAFTTNNNNNGNGKRNLANNNNNGYNYNYGYNNYYNNNQNNNNYNNNNQNNNNYNNNNYNNNNNNQNNNNNNNNQQQEAQQDDDTFRDYGGLNLTQYALKYLGCQNIHTFNDDLADDEDSTTVLAMDRFVVFRLCPKKQCSNYHEYGCAYNYGEYMIPMEDYLQLMQAYHIQQYQEYCQTCHQCMTQTGNFANNNDDDGGGNDDGNGNGNNNNNNNNQRHLNNDNGNNNNGGGGQYANYYYNKNGNYYNRNFGNNNNNGNGNNGNNNNNNYNNGNNNNNNNGNGNNNYNMYAQQDDDQVQNNNYNNYNYNDDNVANDDGNANDDAAAAAAGDDDAYASSKNGNTTSYRCAYADVCETYMEACAGMDTDDNAFAQSDAYSAYFQCSEFNVGGSVSYLGPHCRSDGFTIGIGIYQDENCYTYIGDVVDMQQATGQTFNDDYLSPYYPQQCISCTASESYDLLTDDEMNNEEDGVYEICGYLYQSAAKCNRYMDVETSYKGSKQQQQNEKKVCNFVESLIENNYDEYGEIIQQGDAWEIAKWKQVNAFKGDIVTRASKVQILGMVFSIGLCLSLFGYSFYLRHKLMHRRAWRHGMWTHQRAEEAGRVARASSGITMQRSLSANFTDPSFSQSGSFA